MSGRMHAEIIDKRAKKHYNYDVVARQVPVI